MAARHRLRDRAADSPADHRRVFRHRAAEPAHQRVRDDAIGSRAGECRARMQRRVDPQLAPELAPDAPRGGDFAAGASLHIEELARRFEVISGPLRDSIAHGDDACEAQVGAAGHALALAERGLGSEARALDDDGSARHRRFHLGLDAACTSPLLLDLADMLFDNAESYQLARPPPAGAAPQARRASAAAACRHRTRRGQGGRAAARAPAAHGAVGRCRGARRVGPAAVATAGSKSPA
jgi:hypothetical protein